MALFKKEDSSEENKDISISAKGSNVKGTEAEKKIISQLESDKDNKREIKKGADLNIFKKVYQYLGLVQPLAFTLIVVLLGYMVYEYISVTAQKERIEATNKAYVANINTDNAGLVNILSGYNKTLEKYNEYTDTAINFTSLFKTIEKYIPKDMDRSSLKIKLGEGGKLNVTLNGKVGSYESYISMLSVIDKCNFTDAAAKNRFIQLTRVEFSSTNQDTISENKSVTMQFDFNMNENQILRESYYTKMVKQFSQYGNFLYLNAVTSGKQQDVWSDSGINYMQQMDNIVAEKKKFTTDLTALMNMDENGYHITDKGENFIAEYTTQNKVFDFLINHYTQRKAVIKTKINDVFDAGVVTYNSKGQDIEIVNIKKVAQERLTELDNAIIKLTILKRYNEYLLDNNQLNTFTKLKEDGGDDVEAKISGIIAQKNIITENDPLLLTLTEAGLTAEEKEELRKAAYVEMFNFAKEVDSQKEEALKVIEKYVDTFYSDYYKDNLLNIDYNIVNTFISSGFNENVFANLNYRSFNYNATNANANFSYKKRFYLTLKNDFNMKDKMLFLSNGDTFAAEMNTYDAFKQQEEDIITYNNSKISCLNRDVRHEMLDVYDSVLEDRNTEMEQDKKASELNIIIETIKEESKPTNNQPNTDNSNNNANTANSGAQNDTNK